MKKQNPLVMALAAVLLAVVCSLSAFAEEAIPASKLPQSDETAAKTGLAGTFQTSYAFVTGTGTRYKLIQAAEKRPADLSADDPAEDAVAVMYICAMAHDDPDALLNIDGHAFIIVKNLTDEAMTLGGLQIAPGTGMTFGVRGNKEGHCGLWYNIEGYKNYYDPDYYPGLIGMQVSLTQEMLDIVNRNLALCDKWSAVYNCTHFAAAMWNAVCSDTVSPGFPGTPEHLRDNLLTFAGKYRVDPQIPYDYAVYYGYPATRAYDFP